MAIDIREILIFKRCGGNNGTKGLAQGQTQKLSCECDFIAQIRVRLLKPVDICSY